MTKYHHDPAINSRIAGLFTSLDIADDFYLDATEAGDLVRADRMLSRIERLEDAIRACCDA